MEGSEHTSPELSPQKYSLHARKARAQTLVFTCKARAEHGWTCFHQMDSKYFLLPSTQLDNQKAEARNKQSTIIECSASVLCAKAFIKVDLSSLVKQRSPLG